MITFETAQGSIYSFDEERCMSSRHKKSGGSQQDKIFDYLNVVFVERKLRLYNPKIRIAIGIYKSNGEFHPQNEVPKILLEDQKLVVIEFNRQDNKPLHIQRARVYPEIGFFPYEWGRNSSNQITKHIGNKIIAIKEGNNVITSIKTDDDLDTFVSPD
jgi:hypothetical protein